jgi:GNAT superfamily N-acetyltransferase
MPEKQVDQELLVQDGIAYRVFTAKHRDDAAACLAKQFAEAEAMGRALGLSPADMTPFVERICAAAVAEGLSGVAIEQSTGRLVGCMIARDFAAELPEETLNASPRLAPIMALLETLETDFKSTHTVRPGEYLHAFMLAVYPDAEGKGIGTTLGREVHNFGRRRGFTKVIGEPTSRISQHITLAKLGMRIVGAVEYSSFLFHNTRPFLHLEAPPSCLLVVGGL